MATKINNGGYQQNFNPQTGKYETGKTKRPTYISNKRKLDKINELAKNGKDLDLLSSKKLNQDEIDKLLGINLRLFKNIVAGMPPPPSSWNR